MKLLEMDHLIKLCFHPCPNRTTHGPSPVTAPPPSSAIKKSPPILSAGTSSKRRGETTKQTRLLTGNPKPKRRNKPMSAQGCQQPAAKQRELGSAIKKNEGRTCLADKTPRNPDSHGSLVSFITEDYKDRLPSQQDMSSAARRILY